MQAAGRGTASVLDVAADAGGVVPTPHQAVVEGDVRGAVDVVVGYSSPRVLREGRLKVTVGTG